MDIKIITCHDVYNYGASLQAYALSHYIQSEGHEVKIIDYLPDYKPNMYDLTRLTEQGIFGGIAKRVPFLKSLCGLCRNRHLIKFLGRRDSFDAFKNKFLNLTVPTATSCEMLEEQKMQADLFIAGSDQIWNPNYGNGWDKSYYCGFVVGKSRCISYAASFGVSKIEDDFRLFLAQQLKNFESISVREASGVKLLQELGVTSANVLDPVFLLSKDKWKCLVREKFSFKYLLVYDFHNDNPKLKRLAQRIAKKQGLKIVAINEEITIPYADKNVNDAGPIEFLSLIYGAEVVIASSFHAAAFSIIFNKDFYVFPLLGHHNSSRITDLLQMLKLEDRFDPDDITALHVNYDIPNERLSEKIKFSKNWLTNNLVDNKS